MGRKDHLFFNMLGERIKRVVFFLYIKINDKSDECLSALIPRAQALVYLLSLSKKNF